MDYLLHIMILAVIYALLSLSLDLVAGQIGLLSVAQGAFFGIGAYASALMAFRNGGDVLSCLVVGMLTAGFASLLVSLPSLRLREDYFIIATFGFQMIVYNIMSNWIAVTNGPLGIPGIPVPRFFSLSLDSRWKFVMFEVVVAMFFAIVLKRLVDSPFGRILRAIRENEDFARACGKNTFHIKVMAFAVSAAVAGVAGSLYAGYMMYIEPSGFSIMESILILSMVLIGGAGSFWGPIIGAAFLVLLPEGLRLIGLPNAVAGELRQIIYGSLMIVLMAVRPRGLVGHFDFRRFAS